MAQQAANASPRNEAGGIRSILDQAHNSSYNVTNASGGTKFVTTPAGALPVGRTLSSNIVSATVPTPLNDNPAKLYDNLSLGRQPEAQNAFDVESCQTNMDRAKYDLLMPQKKLKLFGNIAASQFVADARGSPRRSGLQKIKQ